MVRVISCDLRYGVQCRMYSDRSAETVDLLALWPLNAALSGTVPTEIGALPRNLKAVLMFNKLSGTIPTEVGRNDMGLASFAHTLISGTVPTEMGRLTEIDELWLCEARTLPDLPSMTSHRPSTAFHQVAGRNETLRYGPHAVCQPRRAALPPS